MPDISPSSTTPNAGRPRGRGKRIALWLGGALAVCVLLLGAISITALQTERGSLMLWRAGVWLMQGRLSGQFVGGSVTRGLQMRDVHYRDDSTDLSADRVDGRWRFDFGARKLDIAYLHIGNVDLRLQPTPSEPTVFPHDLRLPVALELHDLSMQKLVLRQGAGSNEFTGLSLHGGSDGTQHRLTVDSLRTPYGDLNAQLALSGQRPFALNGGLALSGMVREERYQVDARLGGSLQLLNIAVKASGDKLNGDARIDASPFDAVPLQRAMINLAHINPKAFNAAAPQADIALRADLHPLPAAASASATTPAQTPFTVGGVVNLSNAIPGPIDKDRLPLQSINADVTLSAAEQLLKQLSIKLPDGGAIQGQGVYRPGDAQAKQDAAGDFDLAVTALNLQALHGAMRPTRLRGPLAIKLRGDTQQIGLNLNDPALGLGALVDLLIDTDKLQIRQADLREGKARLEFTGALGQTGDMPYDAKGTLRNFDPALLSKPASGGAKGKSAKGRAAPNAPKGRSASINMDFDIAGAVMPQPRVKLRFKLHDSVYDQTPMTGGGTIDMLGQRLLASDVALLIAGNKLNAKGAFGAPSDRLDVHIDAPQLQRLGYGISGLLQADGQLSGSLQRPSVRATYRAQKLVFGQYRLDSLNGAADFQGDLNHPADSAGNRLNLKIAAQGYHSPELDLASLDADTAGTFASHKLQVAAKGVLRGQALALNLSAQGKLSNVNGNVAWRGSIDRFDNTGVPRFALQGPLAVDVGADHAVIGAGRLNIASAVIDLQGFSYRPDGIRSQGAIQALNIGVVMNLLRQFDIPLPPFKTDLVLDSRWNLALTDTATGFLDIERKSGDIVVNTGDIDVPLGLNNVKLRADLQNNAVNLTAALQASRIGSLNGKGTLALVRQGKLLALTPASALSAHAEIAVPKLETVGALIGPSIVFKGALAAEMNAAGTLGQPKLSGAINGDGLGVTLFDQGIELQNGTVRIVMDENVIDLRQFEFHGGQGTLRAGGKVQLGQANPNLDATLTADHLELFASPDRRLMLSGQAKIASLADQLRIDGKFTVDHGLFDLPKSSAPKLGDDVVIVRNEKGPKKDKGSAALPSSKEKMVAASEKPAGRFSPTIDVVLDLGDDFRFRGGGADLRLRGSMNVKSEPYSPLRGMGTIRVADGTYEAFGVKLAIERGIINFQGPIDNPNINLLAMRRNQEVPAGVEVTGYASAPRVRLVSEPNLSEEEKLSWIMFGQGSSSGLGQRSASTEALAFLGNLGGKRIARDIGLDQFSIGSSESGISTVAGDQFVNLGKAISQRFMLGYEQSLTGAESVAKLTYQLTRSWSVLVRGGTINSLNLLFSRRYD
jgi:translocation and assembly module TamB